MPHCLRASLFLLPALSGCVCNPSESSPHAQAPSASLAGSASAPAPAESTEPSVQSNAEAPDATRDANPDVHPDFDFLPPRSVQADSPHKIGITALQAWVHEYPDDETTYLGYLRAGTVVDRSEGWIVKTLRCKEGWYEVLPRGYLCNGNRATIDVNDPAVVASWKPPRRGDPLPYSYVRPDDTRTYLYFTLPSKKDQIRTEGANLEAHLKTHAPDRIPNLDMLGAPEPLPDFLQPGKALPTPFGATRRLRYNVHEGRANPQAAFALLSIHEFEGRLFGLTTELDLLAIDRVKIVRPTTRKGGPVEDLPAGIVRAGGTPRFELDDNGNPIRKGAYERFQALDLTGKTHRALWEVRDGGWATAGSMDMVEPRTSFPSFAKDDRKWLDVSIKDQRLIAYVGTRAVYVAQVSTGIGGMADPEKSFATARGAFTIKSKHLTATMTGSRQADDYELADVPYVQYFYEGYALHGSFWHDNFGREQSHGCVNLTPTDAAWLFAFTDPVVPPHWHGANASELEPGTVVYVRY